MKNKRGYMVILEVTISILMIAGALLYVYTNNISYNDKEEYYNSIGNPILTDIASSINLRLNVLNTEIENISDSNYTIVNNFVADSIPDNIDYALRICKLGQTFCKMKSDDYIRNVDKEIYINDRIIASEIGTGDGKQVFNPKLVKIFLWEK